MSRLQTLTYENAVRNIQRYLRQLAYFEPELGEFIPLDGIYGDRTRTAVSNYQKTRGIGVSGTVDRLTLERLFREYQDSIIQNSSGRSFSPFYDFPAEYELKIGDENSLVNLVWIMLEELSTIYNFLKEISTIDGIYNEELSKLIYQYQAINKIAETGRINRETWNRIAIDYDRALRLNSQM